MEVSAFGDTVRLTATVADQNGRTIAGAPVSWTSSHPPVATVAADGRVTSVRNGGTTITAASGAVWGTAAVTVMQRAARVEVSPGADTLLSLGDTVQLEARLVDSRGSPVSGAAVAWTSRDEAVAAVDSSGKVTATGNGEAEIVAAAGSVAGTAAITVAQVVVALDVRPPGATLFSLGDTVRLAALGVDANGHPAADLMVEWSSKVDAFATVDSAGLVTAVGTGTTDIFATSGEMRDSSGVTVAQLAAELRVAPSADTLQAAGDTVRLSAVALDANGNEVQDTDYLWSAPQPAVATVDGSGLVTARGPGTAQIRVKATRAGANYVAVAVITVLGSSGGG